MNNKTFYFFNVSELNKVDFTQVQQTSINTVRKSINGTKTFIKFNPSANPSFLSKITSRQGPYNYSQSLAILNTAEWVRPITGSIV